MLVTNKHKPHAQRESLVQVRRTCLARSLFIDCARFCWHEHEKLKCVRVPERTGHSLDGGCVSNECCGVEG